MKCLFVISSSQIGGAEKQFVKTIFNLKENFEIRILVLGTPGPMRNTYEELGFPIRFSSGTLFSDVKLLLSEIVKFDPKVVVSWLYKADLLVGFISRLFPGVRVIASGRNTNWPNAGKLKRKLLQSNARYNVDKIVVNSQRATVFHQDMGFPSQKLFLVRNFIPEPRVPSINHQKITLGIAARPVPGKGIDLAVNIARELIHRGNDIELAVASTSLPDLNKLIGFEISSLSFVRVTTGLTDLNAWFDEIDIYLGLSSAWESDSNSVLEAILNCKVTIVSELSKIEDCDQFSYIINDFDVIQISNKIEEVLSKKALDLDLTKARDALIISRDTERLKSDWTNVIRGPYEK